MKKLKDIIIFALCSLFLMSCGGAGQLPDDNITWGTAFAHVSHSFGYWIFIIIFALVLGYYIYSVQKARNGWTGKEFLIAFGIFAALMIAIFIRPSEVAANTTVEQAARGVWIGY